jgi:hypothetical protein
VTAPPEESVDVVDEERIVPHGTLEVTWFIRKNDAWLHVSQWPGAVVERLSAGAGTVWQNRTQLCAPRGARFMRVASRPGEPPTQNALEYLTRGALKPPRRVRRSYYQLGSGGALLPVRDAPEPKDP